jgi:hypothetical protein
MPQPFELYGGIDEKGVAFRPSSPSLVITRNLTSRRDGTQHYIPCRFLKGLLPSALVDQYLFWQDVDGCLTGYLLPKIQKR